MKRSQLLVRTFVLLASIMLLSAAAQAQATRTWVSGVGDDVNPCSRTAPCKTFAGAISKTAANGEINAIDPGGYGTVTITKSITINGSGTHASILASGTNGVVVNDSATATPNTAVVTLRKLSINGTGGTGANGVNGINFVAGKTVNVENCDIQNFTTTGIRVALTVSGSNLNVKDTYIFRTGTGVSLTTTSGFFTGVLDNVRIENQTTGVSCSTGGFATVRNSVLTFNTTGISITGGANSAANSENSLISHNTTGVSVGASATYRTGRTAYFANNTAIANSGTAVSFINNEMSGNTNNVTGNALSNTAQN